MVAFEHFGTGGPQQVFATKSLSERGGGRRIVRQEAGSVPNLGSHYEIGGHRPFLLVPVLTGLRKGRRR